jgi:UDP-N-acetyl-2-amino-2-deoxyglucuronate dehydrogenase
MNKLRVAFVGCGGIAEHYLKIYRDLPWVEMACCMDTDLARAERAVERLAEGTLSKPPARATDDFNEALEDDVNVVVINTPNHLHCEQALAAFAANKHLLMQKPLAASLEEARMIVIAAARAQKRGVLSGLYMSYLEQPLMHDLRAMVEDGWFGQVVSLSGRLMHRGGLRIAEQLKQGQTNWRASLAQTGGGCFIQHAVHYIHLFEWIAQAQVTRVMAMASNLVCPGIEGEVLASALFELDNGAQATLETSWATAGEALSVRGTLGTAEYVNNQTLWLESSQGAYEGHVVRYAETEANDTPGAPASAAAMQQRTIHAPRLDDLNNPFNQHLQFLEAVREGRPPFVPIATGLHDLNVVQAVYESARSGQAVML